MRISKMIENPAFSRCGKRREEREREFDGGTAQGNYTSQSIRDVIKVIDSSDVNIISFIGQEAITIQVAIQLVLVIIIRLFAESDEAAEEIVGELVQFSALRQAVSQEIVVVDSTDVNIINIDNEFSLELQILIQILLALIVELAIF